jgi:hypothetical protein
MSAGTFAAFSKFFQNTSKSPNGKVVQFVKAHNFHVERHCWFEVQIGEKSESMPVGTIHWGRRFLQLGIKFGHKWLRKRPYALCKSCRGWIGLQLLYLSFGSLQFKNLEKHGSNRAKRNFKRVDRDTRATSRATSSRHAEPPPGARTPRPASDRWSVRGVSRTEARYGCGGLGSRPVPRVPLPIAGRCTASPPLALRPAPAIAHTSLYLPCRVPCHDLVPLARKKLPSPPCARLLKRPPPLLARAPSRRRLPWMPHGELHPRLPSSPTRAAPHSFRTPL